jgi:hypothetical protein
MITESGSRHVEGQFAAAFRALLHRAVQHVSDRTGGLLVPGLVDQALLYSLLQMAEWPEAKDSLALALTDPVLKRLTWDAGGNSISDVQFWVNMTLFPAVHRYCVLATPLGAPRVRGHARRIRRVTDEVIQWAKVDHVPVVTTTLVHGLRTHGKRRFRVTPNTVMRASTLQEWEPVLRAEGPGFQPLCLERREELPRLQNPDLGVPRLFFQALQLALNHPISLGDTVPRPAIPVFSLSNLGGQRSGAGPPHWSLGSPPLVTSKEIKRARQIAVAFEDLTEAGFDLALDLYVASLHRVNLRERAVDIAIALENLYLGKEREESRYRFQLHVLAFARRLKATDRVDIGTAKKLYDARSSVVHGTKPPSDAMKLLNSAGATLARATLLAIVSKRNRRFLQRIHHEVERLVGP